MGCSQAIPRKPKTICLGLKGLDSLRKAVILARSYFAAVGVPRLPLLLFSMRLTNSPKHPKETPSRIPKYALRSAMDSVLLCLFGCFSFGLEQDHVSQVSGLKGLNFKVAIVDRRLLRVVLAGIDQQLYEHVQPHLHPGHPSPKPPTLNFMMNFRPGAPSQSDPARALHLPANPPHSRALVLFQTCVEAKLDCSWTAEPETPKPWMDAHSRIEILLAPGSFSPTLPYTPKALAKET